MKFRSSISARAKQAKHALINWTTSGSPLRLDDTTGWYSSGRGQSKSVSDMQMLTLTPAWRAVKLITETVGSLPLHVMERTGDVPRKAVEHPLYDRLHTKSSEHQTAPAMIEQLVTSMCLWNQAYIRTPGIGSRSELFAQSPAFVNTVVKPNGGGIEYHVSENGRTRVLSRDEITPIDGFKMPGALQGMAMAGLHREALSLAITAEEFGARFFATGGRPTGVLSTDTFLKGDQREQIRTAYGKFLGGGGEVGEMGGLAVLEGGMKYTAISATPDEAQFLGTRKTQVLEIARIFGVPPHMLFEMDRATYSNAEQNDIQFHKYTLLPYLRRIEKAVNAFMFTDSERKKYFVKFSLEGLLRGDTAGRAAYYREGRVGGWLTQNEIRRLEDLPRKDGADDLHVPLNMAPADLVRDIHDKSAEQ